MRSNYKLCHRNFILLVLGCQSMAVLLKKTIVWCLRNSTWYQKLSDGKYQRVLRVNKYLGWPLCLTWKVFLFVFILYFDRIFLTAFYFLYDSVFIYEEAWLKFIYYDQCPRHPIPLFNLLFPFQGEGYYSGHCSLTRRFLYVTLCPTNTVSNNAEIFKRRTRYGSIYGSKLHHIPQHLFMSLTCSSLSLLESCFKQVPLLVNLLFTYTTTFNSRSTLGRFSRIFEIIVTS